MANAHGIALETEEKFGNVHVVARLPIHEIFTTEINIPLKTLVLKSFQLAIQNSSRPLAILQPKCKSIQPFSDYLITPNYIKWPNTC